MKKNILIAKETLEIIKNGRYEVNGTTVTLPPMDYGETEVITDEQANEFVETVKKSKIISNTPKITVDRLDSFESAKINARGKTAVLNFANAYVPGGGFLLGAPAQEESLCRCSTLYASISGEKASEMYRYNRKALQAGGSDYFLLSENVAVFRDSQLNLLEGPFYLSVITAAAPNLEGDAENLSKEQVKEVFCRKIRNISAFAAVRGYRTLVLGAWGCGAFLNDAKDVAEYFYQVIVAEGMGKYFENVVFPIYSKWNLYNYNAFKSVFGGFSDGNG